MILITLKRMKYPLDIISAKLCDVWSTALNMSGFLVTSNVEMSEVKTGIVFISILLAKFSIEDIFGITCAPALNAFSFSICGLNTVFSTDMFSPTSLLSFSISPCSPLASNSCNFSVLPLWESYSCNSRSQSSSVSLTAGLDVLFRASYAGLMVSSRELQRLPTGPCTRLSHSHSRSLSFRSLEMTLPRRPPLFSRMQKRSSAPSRSRKRFVPGPRLLKPPTSSTSSSSQLWRARNVVFTGIFNAYHPSKTSNGNFLGGVTGFKLESTRFVLQTSDYVLPNG
uniref:Uncharacterized protein n=1 Tax=Glossina pallidipes TaxID=7398 RepID=A0A1A9ZJH0_GLOPL